MNRSGHWLKYNSKQMRMREFQRRGQKINDLGLFVGCPLESFASSSQEMFNIAHNLGLQKEHNVLEVGCGCLRAGYWFINYLEPKKYCGIEPNQEMLNAGRKIMLPELENDRNPQFDCNDQFEFGVFDWQFDWIIAFSIWSHCAKSQIDKMIQYAASHKSRLLSSFIPTQPDMEDYRGTEWVGKSHESDKGGVIAHDPAKLLSLCTEAGLKAYLLRHSTLRQLWIYCIPPSE